jgi:hypothetical protein
MDGRFAMSTSSALPPPRQPWRLLAVLVGIVLLAMLFALRVLAGPAPEPGMAATAPAAPAMQAAAAAPPESAAEARLPASPNAAAAAQEDALQAAARDVDRPPLAGPLRARPAFVSEMEWAALQAVARQGGDYDRALLRLVNNLRFHKQLELWRAPGTAPALRRALAARLLADLPARVRDRDYSVATAQQLQQELLAWLEPDPAQRRLRLEQEAQRVRSEALLQEQGGSPLP